MTPDSEFRYYDHYCRRLSERPYLEGLAEMILQNPDATYYDTSKFRFVAVKRLFLLGAERDVAVAYEIVDNIVWLVSLFLLKERQQQNRLREGRWVSYEPARGL